MAEFSYQLGVSLASGKVYSYAAHNCPKYRKGRSSNAYYGSILSISASLCSGARLMPCLIGKLCRIRKANLVESALTSARAKVIQQDTVKSIDDSSFVGMIG